METILLVGCGAMGGALYQGWGGAKNKNVWVVDPHIVPSSRTFKDVKEIPLSFRPSIIIFAIKPQEAALVVPKYALFCQQDTVCVSVMAGIDIGRLEEWLGKKAAMVRCMPNLAVAFQQGAIGLYGLPHALESCQQRLTLLFQSLGKIWWVSQEDHLNLITALSGSGPAYLYYMAEMMAKKAHELGLPLEGAQVLARQTLISAGEVVKNSSLSLKELRDQVTSPQGTTAAGLSALQDQHLLEDLMLAVLERAYQRAKELAV